MADTHRTIELDEPSQGTKPPRPSRPIENVVFDMGNVLMRFDGAYFSGLFADTGEDAALIHQALFARPEWVLLDAGAIDEATMERVALAHLPIRLHDNLRHCLAHWHEFSDPIEETNRLAHRLKRDGLGVYVLSNAGTRFLRQTERMPIMRELDGYLYSAAERLMKPDPAIFRLFCERFDLAPETCLFVDDNADNVEGARVAGMRAALFTGDVDALERAIDVERGKPVATPPVAPAALSAPKTPDEEPRQEGPRHLGENVPTIE